VRRADVAEAGVAQRRIDVLGEVLVEQPEQQPEEGAGREPVCHGMESPSEIDRHLSIDYS
jgi:hypothetical protein